MMTKLQYITQNYPGWTHSQLAHAACKAGVDWVQLRMKEEKESEVIASAKEIRSICNSFKATFILNDFVEIAKAIDSDGVHLGTNDMSIQEARHVLGSDKIIGGTANTLSQIVKLIEDGADYIGLGPFRHTDTKKKLDPIIGASGVESILYEMKNRKIAIPIYVIGGICIEDLESLKKMDVDGIAVSGLITKAIVNQTAETVVRKINKMYPHKVVSKDKIKIEL
ncbi:MAG: thiamine phosphate synthase [Crocinitomicaceae bacterium]|jgi:thiamine-phosphate pyrophosphorylase|nr:thiamine phosphate synthase [Crocinitomicaceae bacterium]